jgi:hypothetical protein
MNIVVGRRGRERPLTEIRWEQVDWKVMQYCGKPAISSCYSVVVWAQHSGAASGSPTKYTFLVDSLTVSLVFTQLFWPSSREAPTQFPPADRAEIMLVSCVDRIDISYRYIVKLGTATVLMCMIYLLRGARYHALFVPCLDPQLFLTPLSEGRGRVFSPGVLAHICTGFLFMRPSIRPALRRVSRPLPTISETPTSPKATPVGGQTNRTSKKSQKHVDLPTAAQDAALPDDDVQRSLGERLSSEQRDEAGYQRLTAYRVCDEFNTGLLSTFLKREHAVTLRLARYAPCLPWQRLNP